MARIPVCLLWVVMVGFADADFDRSVLTMMMTIMMMIMMVCLESVLMQMWWMAAHLLSRPISQLKHWH